MMIKFIVVTLLLLSSVSVGYATCISSIQESTPTARFINNNDGTVTDKITRLMWKKCSEGQDWNISTNTCTGTTTYFTWQEALLRTVDVNAGSAGDNIGYSDWRVPNVKELTSILEYSCFLPAVNIEVFPPDSSFNGEGYAYWSSTIVTTNSGFMYTVSFRAAGTVARPHDMSTPAPVLRLVRDNQ